MNATEKAVCNFVHVIPMWTFQFENQAHDTHFSDTEFQLITIPSLKRNTDCMVPPEWHFMDQRMY